MVFEDRILLARDPTGHRGTRICHGWSTVAIRRSSPDRGLIDSYRRDGDWARIVRIARILGHYGKRILITIFQDSEPPLVAAIRRPSAHTEKWLAHDLDLTEEGFQEFLDKAPRGTPQVYVHVDEGTQTILRIGKAKNGIGKRWSNHRQAFQHHLKGNYDVEQYPEYAWFFFLLRGRQTSVWTIDVQTELLASVENLAIAWWRPLWSFFQPFAKIALQSEVLDGSSRLLAIVGRQYTDPRISVSLDFMEGVAGKWPSPQ